MTAATDTFTSGGFFALADFERAADAVLPAAVRDFVAGGSGAELTLAANRAAFDRLRIVPRTLRDVSEYEGATTLLGSRSAMPVATAPIGYQRLVHPKGELAAVRAAAEAGIPFTVGTLSSYTVEEITAVGATTWFQLYWLRDRERSFDLVRRAEDAGCSAVMLTVDVPWMARRRRDLRNGFVLPDDVVAAHFPAGAESAAHQVVSGESAVARHTAAAFAPSLSWADLEELRRRTRLPLLVKGVLDPADAAQAAESGVDGIVVSNHGGRQMDGAVASIDALAEVCAAVDGRCEVLLDSGVRSGLDVLKALALGASGVLLGRPLLWGLATGGAEGARAVLDLLADELRDALGLAGCSGPESASTLRVVRDAMGAGRTGTAHDHTTCTTSHEGMALR
ncbi:alpha-hydroxy acid oxidase [Streptomyces sp. NPDC102467]|uniref:alpha-hydroxy acid oxidase n=1 Tax=Streptomyces sp. NPDC102467 TaxID=3366179 RepID=UPI0038163668